MSHLSHRVAAFIAAWIVLSMLGTAISAQFLALHLSAMGADVSFSDWLSLTFSNMFSTLPVISHFFGSMSVMGRGMWSFLMGVGLLLAMVGAGAAIKWAPPVFARNKVIVYSVAGSVGVFVLLSAIKAVLPFTPIAAIRTTAGFLLLGLVGAVGGWAYWRVRTALSPEFDS